MNRICHVHRKGVRDKIAEKSRMQGWRFLDSTGAGVYTVPGGGTVDFVPALSGLPENHCGRNLTRYARAAGMLEDA